MSERVLKFAPRTPAPSPGSDAPVLPPELLANLIALYRARPAAVTVVGRITEGLLNDLAIEPASAATVPSGVRAALDLCGEILRSRS